MGALVSSHMTEEDWSARLIKVAAGQIKRYRLARRLSAQQLADACTEIYGLPMKRSVLANLESGRRPTLSLMELLVLAKILQVPPLLLIFPVGDEETIEVLPGLTMNTWDAARWFTGEAPLVISRGDQSGDLAAAIDAAPETLAAIRENSVTYDSDDYAAWKAGNAVQYYREHDLRLRELRSALQRASMARVQANETADERQREAHIQTASAERHLAQVYEGMLRSCRDVMRRESVTPPGLPADLAHIDEARAQNT